MIAVSLHRLVCLGWLVLLPAAAVVAAEEGEAPPAIAAAAATPADPAWDDEDDYDEYALPPVHDPFERVNRTVFKFNDHVYRRVIRPVARGYEKTVPAVARRGVSSFFDNLRFPVRFTSCVLQGKVDRALAETGKVVLNTTAGVGGLIKVSDRFPELRVPAEDFGQVLDTWGVPPGPFLVLPVFGPSSPRDAVGMVGDYLLTPTTWGGRMVIVPDELRVMDRLDWEWRVGISALDTVNRFPTIIDAYDTINRAALDPYVSFRNGYLQYRKAASGR